MQVTCYYDYTCRYSYRAFQLFGLLGERHRDLEVTWATYLLKEVNRKEDEPSAFDAREVESIALLAHSLAHVARSGEFRRYHEAAFPAFHREGDRLTMPELMDLARSAGVDVAKFESKQHRWIKAVAKEHRNGRDKWGVFGTPTLVLEDESPIYLKLSNVPDGPGAADELWHSLWTISISHPEVAEIKRPG